MLLLMDHLFRTLSQAFQRSPSGGRLTFRPAPTQFTGSNLLAILPGVRANLAQQFGDPDNTDLAIRNIDVFKQGSGIMAHDFVSPYSVHVNVGIQREISPDLVLTADFVLRRFVHMDTGAIDFNRWNSVQRTCDSRLRRTASA